MNIEKTLNSIIGFTRKFFLSIYYILFAPKRVSEAIQNSIIINAKIYYLVSLLIYSSYIEAIVTYMKLYDGSYDKSNNEEKEQFIVLVKNALFKPDITENLILIIPIGLVIYALIKLLSKALFKKVKIEKSEKERISYFYTSYTLYILGTAHILVTALRLFEHLSFLITKKYDYRIELKLHQLIYASFFLIGIIISICLIIYTTRKICVLFKNEISSLKFKTTFTKFLFIIPLIPILYESTKWALKFCHTFNESIEKVARLSH